MLPAALEEFRRANTCSSLIAFVSWKYGTVAHLDTAGKGGFFLFIPVDEKRMP